MHLYSVKRDWRRTPLLLALGFAAALALAVVLINGADKQVRQEQLDSLETALRRAAVTCYALEGRYPPSLEHLTERYGVLVDETKFHVYYGVFGRNLMPDIGVTLVGKDAKHGI
jgi:uncharacterized protein (DUF4213/DUF364 family)